MKKSIAARVAAGLERDPNLPVQMVKGGLGELSVDVEGKQVYSGNASGIPEPQL